MSTSSIALLGSTAFTSDPTQIKVLVQDVALAGNILYRTDMADTGSNQILNNKIIGTTNFVEASTLRTTGAPVSVAGAASPVSGQVLTATSATTAVWQSITFPMSPLFFGTGANGSTTIAVATSLASDMYYDNLTIAPGIVLTTNGYRLFVEGTLTFASNTSRISYNGLNAAANLSGSALQTNTIGGSFAGGNGGGAGSVGVNATNGSGSSQLGSAGGAGGTGSVAGGAAGTVSAVTTVNGGVVVFNDILRAIHGRDLNGTKVTGGTGGGGGGGASAGGSAGGGGGSGGGVLIVVANNVVWPTSVTDTYISANGGTGGNAGLLGGIKAGGGGGGGGGVVVFVKNTLVGGMNPLNVTANGGIGGQDGNGVINGATGTAGRVFIF